MGAARPDGLAPLPRRVPQTSLAVELREDAPAVGEQEDADEFTPDHAASSLAGFQLGTLRARDEDDVPTATSTGTDPLGTPEDGLPGTPANSAPTDRNDPPSAPGKPNTGKDLPAVEPLRGSAEETGPADHHHLPGTPNTPNTAQHTPADEPPPGSLEKTVPAQDAAVVARPHIDRS
ncbi:hypothetical protein M2158_007616 [Streptomyces sp. SAI-144]|nr:hypothetical protein [Streptomyces sp. SAI-144]